MRERQRGVAELERRAAPAPWRQGHALAGAAPYPLLTWCA